MLLHSPGAGFPVSAAVTLTALALFGFAKGRAIGTPPLRSGAQTALIGGVAAAAAYFIARLFNTPGG
jgi:VIT1/CCC1 family predicted Fe2+/Mn2+ transporter